MKDIPIQLPLGLGYQSEQPTESKEPAKFRYEPDLSTQDLDAALTLVHAQMDNYIQAAHGGADRIVAHSGDGVSVYREPLVAQEFFPLNQDLEASSLPPEITGWLQHLFYEEADSLYDLELPSLTSVQIPEEVTVSDMRKQLMLSSRSSHETYILEEFIKKREEGIANQKLRHQSQEAKVLLADHLHDSQINLENLSPEQAVELYNRLKNGAELFREMLFFLQLLTNATDLIVRVAPSLRDDLLQLLPSVLIQTEFISYNGQVQQAPRQGFIDPKSMPWMSFMKYWGVENVGGAIRLNVDKKASESADTYQVWLLVAAHELLHILTNYYIEKYTQPGKVDIVGDIPEVEESALAVVFEAISLAGEYLMYEEIQKTELTDTEKILLKNWAEFRYAYLKMASRSWKIIRDSFNGVAHNGAGAGLKYSEGAKLAHAWKKRNWTLNDLELLIREMTYQCNENTEIGSRSLVDLKGISIQRHMAGPQRFNNLSGSSMYEKVIAFLKNITKPAEQPT